MYRISHVLQNLDVKYLYEAPLAMEKEHLAEVACECLHLDCPEPDLADWKKMVDDLYAATHEVTIALVGKYTQLHDAYISVVEALKHGGIPKRTTVNIRWIDSETGQRRKCSRYSQWCRWYSGSGRFRRPWYRRYD